MDRRVVRTVVSTVLAAVGAACGGEQKIAGPEPASRVRVSASVGTDPVTGATIETNQNDYVPGEIVHVDGRGWSPNETVNLFMSEDPDTHPDVTMDVQADSLGAFSVHFYDVQQYDLGVMFTMTATGRTSGSKAVTTFTDGNISFTTSPANLVTSLTYDRYNASASCTGSPNATANTLAYDGNLGLNEGQSILLTIPTVAGRTFTGVTAGGITITQPSSTTLCVAGPGSGTQLAFVLNYSGSSSQATTTSVASSANPSVTGQGVTFTATVKVGTTAVTTGNVTFKLGGTSCADASTTISGPTTLDGSGNATSTSRAFNATETGAVVRACYGGGSGFNASEGTVSQTVDKAATKTVLADAPATSSVGDAVTFTATVTADSPGAGTPTGVVKVYEFTGQQTCTALGAAVVIGTGSAGVGISVSSLSAGSHTITACYEGDANFAASAGTDTHSVSLVVTTTEIASSANPSVTGQSVTFTATVKSGGTAIGAQGNVDFKAGGTSCSDAAATTFATAVALNASGQAQASQTFAAVGSPMTIRACYAGNTSYASSDGFLSQVVNKAATTTSLAASPSPSSTYGQTVTFTATVAAVSPGSGTPTGSVTFRELAGGSCASPNGTLIGTASLSGGTASVTSNDLTAAAHTITACYGSDANFSESGGSANHTVDKALLTITASSGSKVFGTTYTVTPSYGGFVLNEGASVLTTAPVCSSTGSVTSASVAGSPYTTTCSGAAASNYSFKYVDGSLTVTAATTTLTLATPATTQYSDKVKLSVSLSPATLAGSDQAGSVTFKVDGASVGSASLSNGQATLTIANGYEPKSYNVTAEFKSSNTNFGDDTDGPVTLPITKEDATITADAANAGAFTTSQPVTLKFSVKETNPELAPNPDPDGLAAAGDISKADLTAKLDGISAGGGPTGTCTQVGLSGSSYNAVRTFSCAFGIITTSDAYTLSVNIGGNYYTGSDEDAITVYDPTGGFVTGGGKFVLDGQRVSFGLSFTYQKGKTTPRGGLVVVRHHPDGGRCRVKSNSLDAPAVNGFTASFSGKGNYSCVDAAGATTASAGNLNLLGYVEDNGTSGIGQDKFWIRAYGELMMALQAPGNAVLLTGGNIQVPQPSSPR